MKKILKELLFPKYDRKFFIRLAVVALLSYLFFGYICIPVFISGASMEPAYSSRGFDFCWRPAFWFSSPKRHDVVIVRLAGKKVMLLKRIVALEGETVEFRKGRLYVDGREIDEPYVKKPCDWELPPRKVEKDCVYVVGDNRSTSMERHEFGQTSKSRIMGAPLW